MLARKPEAAAEAARDAIIGQHRVMKRNRLIAVEARTAKPSRWHFAGRGADRSKPGLSVPTQPTWSYMQLRIFYGRTSTWALPAAVFLLIALASPVAHAQSAKKLFKQGQQAEAKDNVLGAYQAYHQAYQKDPEDLRYKTSYERLRFPAASLFIKQGETLRAQGDDTGALTDFLQALEIDPSNELATQDIRATREKLNRPTAPDRESAMPQGETAKLSEMAGPVQLKPISNEPLTLHMVEDSKVVYQTVGKAAGINVLFDPDYHSTRIQVDLSNVTLFDALRIIGTVSGTFWRPVTSNTIFVAQNTRGKRMELDDQAVQTFYLTNVSQQNDLNDIQTALRNVFTTAKLYGVPSQNAIIMRGTPDELLLAQKLINDLDKAQPEVVVDVAILEVSKNWERNIGLQLPQTASIAFQQSNANLNNTTSTTGTTGTGTGTGTTPTTGSTGGLTLNNLAHLNASNFAVSIGQATANLLLTNSSTQILQNPRIRASDGQEATLKIGERLPVATGSYQTGAATAIVSSLVNTQFQYLDVGVNIDMKPTVHYDGDITLKLKIEVSSSTSTSNLGGINEPIINQRTVDQTIRLKNGEASILGGILQHQNSLNVSGYPGLAKLPVLKYIFGNQDRTKSDDEIVFLLIPHIVRAEQISPLNLREVDTGTTNDIEIRRTQAKPAVTQPSQSIPAASAASAGTVPGQSAAGAASTAIQQMGQQAAPQGNPPAPAAAANPAAPIGLTLTPQQSTQTVGSTFQIAVDLTGGHDVYSVPLQMQYDENKLSLINVDLGGLLGKDGQAVALVHRDDGSGGVAISASRPPGAGGISGSGTVCRLTFKAKAPGDASIAITRPMVRNSAQAAMPATGSQAIVHVQ